MTLKIYDIATDEYREATQADIDGLLNVRVAYGVLRTGMLALLEVNLAVAQGRIPAFDAAQAVRAASGLRPTEGFFKAEKPQEAAE